MGSDDRCPCASVELLEKRVTTLEGKNDGLLEKVSKIAIDVMEIKTQMRFFLYISGASFVVAIGVIADSFIKR